MKLLFLCTGNSCRSQMAEALAKDFYKRHGNVEFYSAGTQKHGMNELTIRVIEELGISMKGHYSKTLEELGAIKFDYVITVCSHAHETCPIFKGDAKVIHQGFDDPPFLAKDMNDKDVIDIYRRVRDEIQSFVPEIEKLLTR